MVGFFMSAGTVTPWLPSDGELWWLKSSYPVVMTNSSPWLSHGPNRNRWLPNLIAWWIFQWLSHNQMVNHNEITMKSIGYWAKT